MNNKVLVLKPWQVWDPAKGCFFVDLDATKERHRGNIVHTDKTGRRIVILEAAQ